MPTYEYECPNCGVFELFQGMKDERLKTCPSCRSRKVRRLMGRGAGIIFKGSGFYQTDYRSSGYHSQSKADNAGKAAAPDAGGSPAAPAKPAETPSGPSAPAPAAPAAAKTAGNAAKKTGA